MLTLKELRKFKGLTQEECAKVVGVPLRTYQNYENDSSKESSYKYYEIMKSLMQYGRQFTDTFFLHDSGPSFETEVLTDEKLFRFKVLTRRYKKRHCYEGLKYFIENENLNKVCILYGLRRTGKTTLIFQMIDKLPLSEVAYIRIKKGDTMDKLTNDLKKLVRLGYKYVFIDEITLIDDFIDRASVLSDLFSITGIKIVLSGTDSLGFDLASRNELYDRCVLIHTSYISYKEHATLLNVNSVDTYIEYGGTLVKENMTFKEKEMYDSEITFKDYDTTHKYIDTAIAHNIQHSIICDTYGSRYDLLKELYEKGELTNVINRVVEDINHKFTLEVIERKFKSHDLGSTKQLLDSNLDEEIRESLRRIDEEKVLEKMKSLVNIKEKIDQSIKVTDHHLYEIKKYLYRLDLLYKSNIVYQSGASRENIIVTQPGLRYSLAKALVESLLEDTYFRTMRKESVKYITTKLLEDVKGRMLEDIVTLTLAKNKEYDVFKFIADEGEIDIVKVNKTTSEVELFEVKHSDKIIVQQQRHLVNKDINEVIEYRYGKIISRNVIYKGKSQTQGEINYINVEEFLMNN